MCVRQHASNTLCVVRTVRYTVCPIRTITIGTEQGQALVAATWPHDHVGHWAAPDTDRPGLSLCSLYAARWPSDGAEGATSHGKAAVRTLRRADPNRTPHSQPHRIHIPMPTNTMSAASLRPCSALSCGCIEEIHQAKPSPNPSVGQSWLSWRQPAARPRLGWPIASHGDLAAIGILIMDRWLADEHTYRRQR